MKILLKEYEGLLIYCDTEDEHILKRLELFNIFTFHPIIHYYNKKGDYIGGEVIIAESSFKNIKGKFDIIIDATNVIWKKLFDITIMGNVDYERHDKIHIFHYEHLP